MTPRPTSSGSLEALFLRYREGGDAAALAELFDRCAPGLLRLARRIAGPKRRDWAEDALQDTFLALVERPDRFDDEQPLLPWLSSVLIRRLRDLERKEARRPEPRRVAANRGLRESTDPLQETAKGELLGEIDRAVRELPEGMRRVVEGKLSGTRSTEELARELGISAGSFRVRFHRALTRLRDRLPQSLLGGLALFSARERVLANTRSHVLRASGLTVPSALVPVSIGAMLMTKKAALVLLAVMLGVVTWRVLQVETPSPDVAVEPAEETLPSLSVVDVERETLTEIATEPVEDALRTQVASSRASLCVQVSMGATGAALAGETVSIFFRDDGELQSLSSETDAQGEARFDVDPDRTIAGLGVVPTASHAGGAYRYPLDLESGEDRTVEIAVNGGGTVRGTVVDRSGQPVPHARVFGWCIPNDEFLHHRETVADAAGRFVVENLGPRFVLKATSESQVCHRGLRGELTEGQLVEGAVLVLSEPTTLRGRVVNEIGLPVPEAQVRLFNGIRSTTASDATGIPGVKSFQAGQGRAVTDAEGRFALTGLPERGAGSALFHYSLTIEHQSYDALRAYSDGGGTPERDYVLLAPITLLGQVLDRFGKPAVGAEVRGAPLVHSRSKDSSPALTDEEGRFALRGFRNPRRAVEYDFSLRVLHQGHALLVKESFNPLDYQSQPLVLRLDEPEKRLAGRVVDGAGNPVVGARLSLEGSRVCRGNRYYPVRTWERFCGLAETRTGAEGEFAFDKLYSGEFQLRVVDPSDEERALERSCTAGSTGIEIVMSDVTTAPVRVTGTVRPDRSGETLTAFTVSVYSEGTSEIKEFRNSDGQFEISGLLPGRYNLLIQAPGFAPWSRSEQWLNRGENRILASLQPARSVEVHLVGENVENAIYTIESLDRDGNAVLFQSAYSPSSSSIETSKGKALLHRLPAQALILRVSNPSFSQDFEVDLTDPIEGPLTLELGPLPGAAVWIQLTEARQDPYSSFHLVFEGVDQSVLSMVFRGKGEESQARVLQRFAYSSGQPIEDLSRPFLIRLPEGESVLRLHAGTAPGRVLDIVEGRYTQDSPLEIDVGSL